MNTAHWPGLDEHARHISGKLNQAVSSSVRELPGDAGDKGLAAFNLLILVLGLTSASILKAMPHAERLELAQHFSGAIQNLAGAIISNETVTVMHEGASFQ